MVKKTERNYQYVIANEEELDALLSGRARVLWDQLFKPSKPRPGMVGVVFPSDESDDPIRPLALIVNDDEIRRLCGRYAQLHSDLSPLTAWCHLLTPRFFEPLDSLVRTPHLGGLEAAWTGLIIAETLLIAEKPLASIKISACWTSHSFAVAKASALWNHLAIGDITRRLEQASRLFRSDSLAQRNEGRATKIRSAFQPIWEVLIGLYQGRGSHRSGEFGSIIFALRSLIVARGYRDPQEVIQLISPLLPYIPEAESFKQLDEIAPEGRLRLFDKLVEALDGPEIREEGLRRIGLTLLAGYLATIAAGGSPSLALVESHASRWPEITAWAYLIGGLGEKVVWTSSFDGLGRLVARELLRPLHLDEPPTCDFAFEEAEVLADAKLADPLVHLKVKQARLLTVELFPGVNVAVPIGEPGTQGTPKPDTGRSRAPEATARDPIALLVDAIWPHIETRIDAHLATALGDEGSERDKEGAQRSRGKRKLGTSPQLPFGGSQKKY